MTPILQKWDGDLLGDTGQGKGSSQNLGSGWPWGSGVSAVSCTPHSMGFLLFQRESNPHGLSHRSEKV